MKKLGLLVIPLVTISLLASCGNNSGGNEPEPVEFSIIEPEVTYDFATKEVTLNLDWAPIDHQLKFSNFTFKLKNHDDIIKNVTTSGVDNRPLPITITFKQDLDESDYGTLSFRYDDKTAKTEGEAKIENIHIDTHKVNEEEFEDAISLETVPDGGFLQLNVFEENLTKFEISENASRKIVKANGANNISYTEQIVFKDGNTYTKYHRDNEFAPFIGPEDATVDDFLTKESPSIKIIPNYLEELGLTYENFAFNEEDGAYETYNDNKLVRLYFKNKRVSKLIEGTTEDPSLVFNYAYEEITPHVDVNIVTKEEFNEAVTLTSAKEDGFLQFTQVDPYFAGGGTTLFQLSPNAGCGINNYPEYPEYYGEIYEFKDADNNCVKYSRSAPTVPFEGPTPFDAEDFVDVNSPEINILSAFIESYGLAYEDFTYNEEIHSYVIVISSLSEIGATIYFEDKKVKTFDLYSAGNLNREFLYSYEKIVPHLPE